ncbi:hypothetical protein MBANPS3_000129 [Mucor bainieri]
MAGSLTERTELTIAAGRDYEESPLDGERPSDLVKKQLLQILIKNEGVHKQIFKTQPAGSEDTLQHGTFEDVKRRLEMTTTLDEDSGFIMPQHGLLVRNTYCYSVVLRDNTTGEHCTVFPQEQLADTLMFLSKTEKHYQLLLAVKETAKFPPIHKAYQMLVHKDNLAERERNCFCVEHC